MDIGIESAPSPPKSKTIVPAKHPNCWFFNHPHEDTHGVKSRLTSFWVAGFGFESQDVSETFLGHAENGSRRPKTPPRRPKTLPKTPQETSKTPQDASQMPQDGPNRPPGRPTTLQVVTKCPDMRPNWSKWGPSTHQMGANGDQVGTKWEQVGTK